MDLPDSVAEAIGQALIHEAVNRLARVRLGVCEAVTIDASGARRCRWMGLLVRGERGPTRMLCPRHGGSVERAVRT
jgi:hypothetical protein